MSDARVVFDRVSKKFRRGERHDSLRDLIPSMIKRLASHRPPADRLMPMEFWAVRDVSFAVRPGEALGIVGPNGAGKSTVLKLLTRILRPTSGSCQVKGRVGALIELAAGFHPDLTGRENVYLQGAIMGMRGPEIDASFDEIVEFAGVTDFVDTPVKRYSSGMNARLGFSIAAHLRPDVLLIDEVLAVGDGAFQERCYERMQGFRREGVAIVFVSHNLAAVRRLCDRVLVLRNGCTQIVASPTEAFSAYAGVLEQSIQSSQPAGSHEVVLDVLTESGLRAESFTAGSKVVLNVAARLARTTQSLASAVRIRRLDHGDIVFFTTSTAVGEPGCMQHPADEVRIRWTLTANLVRGQYSVELVLFDSQTQEIIVRLNPAAHFGVTEDQSGEGIAFLDAGCETTIDVRRRAPSCV